jgi:hypothetical protein
MIQMHNLYDFDSTCAAITVDGTITSLRFPNMLFQPKMDDNRMEELMNDDSVKVTESNGTISYYKAIKHCSQISSPKWNHDTDFGPPPILYVRQLHRIGGPALIMPNDGDKYWYVDNKLHRVDGPAICASDREEWFLNGRCSRPDGPSVVYFDGSRTEWWDDGKRHRIGGPAAVCGFGKFKLEAHFVDGRPHREDGPALSYGNDKLWCLNGHDIAFSIAELNKKKRRKLIATRTIDFRIDYWNVRIKYLIDADKPGFESKWQELVDLSKVRSVMDS